MGLEQGPAPGPSCEQAVGEHGTRPGTLLLGGLADHEQRAAPLSPGASQQRRRADPGGHVHVVPARVHHRDGIAGLVLDRHVAGVGQAGLLLDREGVQIRAQHDGWPLAVAQDTDDAMSPDPARDFKPELVELRGQLARRRFLMEGKLRGSVQVQVELLQLRVETVEGLEHLTHGEGWARGRDRRHGGQHQHGNEPAQPGREPRSDPRVSSFPEHSPLVAGRTARWPPE